MPDEATSLATLATTVREKTDGTSEREALLERIAAEIRQGRYEVKADELASTLLKEFGAPCADGQSESASELEP